MNTESCIESYKKILKPLTNDLRAKYPDIEFMWEADCASSHRSKKSRKWVAENGFQHAKFGGSPLLEPGGHPASSPDIFPIEKLFNILQYNVSLRNPTNVEDLMKVAREEWAKIPMSTVRKAIVHCAKGIVWVRENNGEEWMP